jgi:hypothetical protein
MSSNPQPTSERKRWFMQWERTRRPCPCADCVKARRKWAAISTSAEVPRV